MALVTVFANLCRDADACADEAEAAAEKLTAEKEALEQRVGQLEVRRSSRHLDCASYELYGLPWQRR